MESPLIPRRTRSRSSYTEEEFARIFRESPSPKPTETGGATHGDSRRRTAVFAAYEQWMSATKAAHGVDEEKVLAEKMLERLIGLLDDAGDERVSRKTFLETLAKGGLLPDDPRLAEMFKQLEIYGARADVKSEPSDGGTDDASRGILISDLAKIAVAGGQVVINVLSSHIAIPDFAWFCQELQGIYDGVAQDHTGGSISTLIPELAEQLSKTPDQFVVSVCSVDGQRFSIGNADDLFCLQACTNPFTYGMALEEHGVHKVHEHVGREPSGRAYNDFASFKTIPVAERTSPEREAIPHNPMISTGALLCSSLIKPELPVAARLSYYMKVWSDLCGGNVGDRNAPTCTASIMLSERENADRIKALGFMMKESNTFDGDVDLASVLELYFSTCATSVSTGMLSVAAATLGNAGQNPLTGKHVFSEDTNQSILSLMLSCGMNSESGTWAFDVGLPAKSGMSGGLLLVVPKVCGIAIFSPRVNDDSNSVKGVAFAKKLVETFSFHHLDSQQRSQKFDATQAHRESQSSHTISVMMSAAVAGDIGTLKLLISRGFSPNVSDYDHRTPLHVAASDGRSGAVQFLLLSGADCFVRDRWGKTPLQSCEEIMTKEKILEVGPSRSGSRRESNIAPRNYELVSKFLRTAGEARKDSRDYAGGDDEGSVASGAGQSGGSRRRVSMPVRVSKPPTFNAF